MTYAVLFLMMFIFLTGFVVGVIWVARPTKVSSIKQAMDLAKPHSVIYVEAGHVEVCQ